MTEFIVKNGKTYELVEADIDGFKAELDNELADIEVRKSELQAKRQQIEQDDPRTR